MASVVGGSVEPRAHSILKETRAPTVVVSRVNLDEKLGPNVVEGLSLFFRSAAFKR